MHGDAGHVAPSVYFRIAPKVVKSRQDALLRVTAAGTTSDFDQQITRALRIDYNQPSVINVGANPLKWVRMAAFTDR